MTTATKTTGRFEKTLDMQTWEACDAEEAHKAIAEYYQQEADQVIAEMTADGEITRCPYAAYRFVRED